MTTRLSITHWPGSSVLLGLLVALSSFSAAHADEFMGRQALAPLDDQVEVFVRLDRMSVAEYRINGRASGSDPSAEAQRDWARSVSEQQAEFRSVLASYGAEVLSTMRVGANGFRVVMNRSEIANLAAHPNVRSVAEVTHYFLDNAGSVPWIGAPEFWDAVGTGEGVSVGIIDTGLDYLHANLGGAGDPAEYAANDPTTLADGGFNAKVVGGHDFVGDDYNASDPANDTPMPDEDPLDCQGHGSHVGGTAAGLGVGDTIGPGVAKGADLYALKVFGCAGSTDVTSDAIEWALDPNGDGDTSDHLDVINMSLGSSRGSPDDPSAISSDNAAELGIIVVASAGNSGPQPYVTGAPGVSPKTISVAASTKGGDVLAIEVSSPMDVAGRYEAIEAAFTPTLATTGPVDGPLSVPAVAGNFTGCNPISNDMSDSIALISRGACRFDLKVANAEAAGADGVVIYNSNPGPPIVMGGNPGATIPAVMITLGDGTLLAGSVATETTTARMAADLTTETAFGDLIAGFSSRGPGHGSAANANLHSQFKPEVTAPGVGIVSTGVGSGTGSRTLQGTSMAAPHVAGVGALLRQLHPDLESRFAKSMIMNATVDMNPAGGLLPLTLQGTGRVSVPDAAALSSIAHPGAVSFGRLNPLRPRVHRETVWVVNMADEARTYNVTHVPNQTVPGVEASCPETVNVGPNGERAFRIRVALDPEAMPPDFGGALSQTEVDGWCVLDDGVDTLRVGYLAVVDPASRIIVHGGGDGVRLRNPGPAAGTAEAFTWNNRWGEPLDGTQNSISQVGFRTNNLSGFDVIEIAITTDNAWELMSQNRVDIFIDVDGNGTDDFQLVAADWSTFNGTVGRLVTAQFIVGGGGFLDWLPGGADYNDHTMFIPFTLDASGGFVPSSFDYRMEFSARDGTVDVLSGSIDLADEITHDMPSLIVGPGDAVDVDSSGPDGYTLWLFQGNQIGAQWAEGWNSNP